MASAATAEKKIKVTTSDGANLETDRDIAERSILIKNLLEDLGGDNEEAIPIPNVCTHCFRLTHQPVANSVSRSMRPS